MTPGSYLSVSICSSLPNDKLSESIAYVVLLNSTAAAKKGASYAFLRVSLTLIMGHMRWVNASREVVEGQVELSSALSCLKCLTVLSELD